MNLDNVIACIDTNATSGMESINTNLEYSIVNNPQSMLNNQWAVMQYVSYLTYGSTLLKMYRDLISGIIAKI